MAAALHRRLPATQWSWRSCSWLHLAPAGAWASRPRPSRAAPRALGVACSSRPLIHSACPGDHLRRHPGRHHDPHRGLGARGAMRGGGRPLRLPARSSRTGPARRSLMNSAVITRRGGTAALATAASVSWFLTVQQMPAAMIRLHATRWCRAAPPGVSTSASSTAAHRSSSSARSSRAPGGGDPAPEPLLPVAAGLGIHPDPATPSSSWPRWASGSTCPRSGWASSSRCRDRRTSRNWTGPPALMLTLAVLDVLVLLVGLLSHIILVPDHPHPAHASSSLL